MTRETKIGLLVGLAFIIVIGILLSDHLTSSTEPPPATLAKTGDNVRGTITTPGGTQPPITPVVTAPQVQPQQPVPTGRDLIQPANPTAIVQVGGPSAAQEMIPQPQYPQSAPGASEPPITIAVEPQQPAQPAQPAPLASSAQDSPQGASADTAVYITRPADAPVPTSLQQVAMQHNEQLVGMNGQPIRQTTTPMPAANANAARRAGYSEYTAQAGDSLSRIASRCLGANTKANRDAIIRANPSLQADPDKVIAGKTYRIPAAGAAEPAIAAQGLRRPAAQSATPAASSMNPATEYWYTVKEGDSLWKIASEQLGRGGSAVAAIKELNKDVLKGGDIVQPNMKLRLPGKPLAQAN